MVAGFTPRWNGVRKQPPCSERGLKAATTSVRAALRLFAGYLAATFFSGRDLPYAAAVSCGSQDQKLFVELKLIYLGGRQTGTKPVPCTAKIGAEEHAVINAGIERL